VGSTSLYANCVKEGLAAGAFDRRQDLFGVCSSYNVSYFANSMVSQQYSLMQAAGFTNFYDFGPDSTNVGPFVYSDLPVKPQFGFVMVPCPLYDNSMAGAQIGSNWNTYLPQNNFTVSRGAVCFCWWSFSYVFGCAALHHGAAASVMTVGEPYSAYISHCPHTFWLMYNQRLPVCMANAFSPTPGAIASYYNSAGGVLNGLFKTNAPLGSGTYGDPLTTPFATTPPPVGVLPGKILTH
jgi:hypothetical protein